MRISIDLRSEEFERRLDEIVSRTDSLVPMGELFRTAMLRSGTRRFMVRGPGWRGTDGEPRTLHRTGALERALTRRGAPGQQFSPRRNEVIFGLDRQGPAYYGHFLHPRFRLIGLARRDRATLTDELRAYILG